ncbi:flagellar motor protein MotB, partial [Pseudomonas sp. FW215-L1]|uniref:hypothetical protein n=1 Tax=Pseudomonas sp. FW215-L1 TaxID=2070614 RepID=UPI000CC87CCB
GYKSADVNGYRSTVTTPGGFPAGSYGGAGGRSSALSFMVNGLLDFGDSDEVQGFVGGGGGVARVKEGVSLGASRFLNDSDTVFAYQGIAG